MIKKIKIVAKPSHFWDYFIWLVYLPWEEDPIQFTRWSDAVNYAIKISKLRHARGYLSYIWWRGKHKVAYQ